MRRAGRRVVGGLEVQTCDPHTSHSDHTINKEVILRESVLLWHLTVKVPPPTHPLLHGAALFFSISEMFRAKLHFYLFV